MNKNVREASRVDVGVGFVRASLLAKLSRKPVLSYIEGLAPASESLIGVPRSSAVREDFGYGHRYAV